MGAFNIPQGTDLGASFSADPGTRKRLLQMVMGSDASATMDPPQNDRIADDTTRHPQGFESDARDSDVGFRPRDPEGGRFPNFQPGSTEDLESRASAGRTRLLDQIRQNSSAAATAPSYADRMQQRYDELGRPERRGIGQTLLRAFVGGFGSPQQQQQLQQRDEFEESQRSGERGRLLQEIEAERRMQEQNELESQREAAAYERQLATQRETDQRQAALFRQQQALEDSREAARQQQATLAEKVRQQQQQDLFAQQDKRQSAQFAEQEKLQGMREEAADRRAQRMADTRGETNANKRFETAMDADQRLSRMESAYGKGLKGDQQAMLSLLTDHIGMTLGMQKGARITKDILTEATQSQPWLAKIRAKFDDRGYLSGVTLGPDQMRQMLDLGYEARDRAVQGAYEDSQLYGVKPPPGAAAVFGKRKMGEKPALEQSGGGHSFTFNGQRYENVPDELYKKYKTQPGFSE